EKKRRLVTHGLKGYEFEKTYNNDKNLSEIQLGHEKEDKLVAVVVKVVNECRHWMGQCVNQRWWKCCEVSLSFDLLVDCMMVVKEIENELLEEVELSHFGKKKLEHWLEQYMDDEGEEDEEDGGYSQNSKAYIILNKHTRKVEQLLNVTFDETPPPLKTPPLLDDDLDEEEAIKVTDKNNLENDIEDETLEIDEIVNIRNLGTIH
nr:hypothetical protein [Tanacetum cinerariifolium]